MGGSLLRICVILGVSSALGTGWAALKDMPWAVDVEAVKIRMAGEKKKQELIAEVVGDEDQTEDDLRQTIRKEASITLDELRAYIEQGAVIIDARGREKYEREHLYVGYQPPVLNVPEDQIEQNLPRLLELMGLPMVLYCNSAQCDLAEDLYLVLRGAGVTDVSEVKIFVPGWEGLEKSDLPKTSGPDDWRGFDAEPDESAGGAGLEPHADDASRSERTGEP